MKYRLVALDLDGTLLNSRMQIQRETVEALKRVREKGVQVMVVTGRHHVAAYPYWDQLGLELPAVCCNGTYVYDYRAGQALANNPLRRTQAHQLLGIARRHGIHCMVYVDDAMAYESVDAHMHKLMNWAASLPERVRPELRQVERFADLIDEVDTVWKFATASDDLPALRAFEEEVTSSMRLSCEWSANNRVDVAQTGNSKGGRLAEWIASNGIDPSEVIAFGDHRNDIGMLEIAGMGVAMGNADAVVQSSANWVTGSNDGTGIADALQRFVLQDA